MTRRKLSTHESAVREYRRQMLKKMTVKERAEAGQKQMLAISHEAHLNNLLNSILDGNIALLVEFQQQIQYAHPVVKNRLLQKLDKTTKVTHGDR